MWRNFCINISQNKILNEWCFTIFYQKLQEIFIFIYCNSICDIMVKIETLYFACRVIFVAFGCAMQTFYAFSRWKVWISCYIVAMRDIRIILNRAGVVIPPETPSGCLFLKYFWPRFSGIQSSIFHISSQRRYVSARIIIIVHCVCVYVYLFSRTCMCMNHNVYE